MPNSKPSQSNVGFRNGAEGPHMVRLARKVGMPEPSSYLDRPRMCVC
jgi:hypothetical protein